MGAGWGGGWVKARGEKWRVYLYVKKWEFTGGR